jgi:DMSO/TMAO reductase YedYZ molybdopterin-dependent catalytic subunit
MTERSIRELYQNDPERADAVAFGRKAGPDGHGFTDAESLAAMSGAVGAPIPFSATMPAGLMPAAPNALNLRGKDKLVVLGDSPLVAETPPEWLDDETTPIGKFYIRNNGRTPEPASDAGRWTVTIDGEVAQPLTISLGELKAKYKAQTRRMVLECAGNGRSAFRPGAKGTPWNHGGVGCAEWTGISLRDLIATAMPTPDAVYTAHYGADTDTDGKIPLSRGVRLAKAMDPDSMIVWAMNGEPLPNIHGGPVRLIYPGWAGSLSHKWLTKITLRDREHDGPGMTGFSYRVPIKPMVPGEAGDPANMRILEQMPVRALVTNPANGARYASGTRAIALRGAAWAGDLAVKAVDVSLDFGATWQGTTLSAPKNKYDWQRWTASVSPPSDGYYEIWVRGTDSRGVMQPIMPALWNPQGYGGNAMQRIGIFVG